MLRQLKRPWVLVSLVALPLVVCLGLAAVAWAVANSSPEVHAPYPDSELVSSQTSVNGNGLHTVRVYRVPAMLNSAVGWYTDQPSYGDSNAPQPRTFSVGKSVPVAHWPFPFWQLLHYTEVRFINRQTYTEVVTDTYYYGRRSQP